MIRILALEPPLEATSLSNVQIQRKVAHPDMNVPWGERRADVTPLNTSSSINRLREAMTSSKILLKTGKPLEAASWMYSDSMAGTRYIA